MMNVDTEMIVNEVEKRPALWDSSSEEYKDRGSRPKVWYEICDSLIVDFKEMGCSTQENWVEKIQTRWRTARDAYTRYKNGNKQGKFKAKKLAYFDNMRFLDRALLRKKASNNGVRNGSMDETAHGLNSLDKVEEDDCNPSPRQSAARQRKRRLEESSFEERLLEMLKECVERDDDADHCFFVSLLPTLKTFDDDQKLQFRMQVLGLMTQIKNNGTSQNQTRSYAVSKNRRQNNTPQPKQRGHSQTSLQPRVNPHGGRTSSRRSNQQSSRCDFNDSSSSI